MVSYIDIRCIAGRSLPCYSVSEGGYVAFALFLFTSKRHSEERIERSEAVMCKPV